MENLNPLAVLHNLMKRNLWEKEDVETAHGKSATISMTQKDPNRPKEVFRIEIELKSNYSNQEERNKIIARHILLYIKSNKMGLILWVCLLRIN